MDSDVARFLKGGTRKTGLTGDLFTSAIRASLAGNPGPLPSSRKKIEFGIGGDAISACIEGSLAFFSLFLVDILSRSEFLPTPPYFYAISTNCETHISKSGVTPDLPWLRQC